MNTKSRNWSFCMIEGLPDRSPENYLLACLLFHCATYLFSPSNPSFRVFLHSISYLVSSFNTIFPPAKYSSLSPSPPRPTSESPPHYRDKDKLRCFLQIPMKYLIHASRQCIAVRCRKVTGRRSSSNIQTKMSAYIFTDCMQIRVLRSWEM